MAGKIIHHQDSADGNNHFIRPYGIRKFLKLISEKDFIEGEENVENLVETGGYSIYLIQDCAFRYIYSPGLGNFPREIEKIFCHGNHNKLGELEKFLKDKGLKLEDGRRHN